MADPLTELLIAAVHPCKNPMHWHEMRHVDEAVGCYGPCWDQWPPSEEEVLLKNAQRRRAAREFADAWERAEARWRANRTRWQRFTDWLKNPSGGQP